MLVSLASLLQLAKPPLAAAATMPTTVAAGWTHACVIRSGKAYCWGDNTYGELGNDSSVSSPLPVPVYTGGALSGVTLTQITAGNGFTCALSSAGAAYCWGANAYGELGINSGQAASDVPVAVSAAGVLSGVTLSQVSAGQFHACALSAAGAAYCWGWNADGQLGNNSTVNSTAPVAVSTSGVLSGLTLTQVTAGGLHSCALAGGKAYCWGGNPHGQLGNGGTTSSSVPVAVSTSGVLSGLTLTGVVAGYEQTCALSSAGADYCWGIGSHGDLGNGSNTDQDVPVAVSQGSMPTGTVLTQIAAGSLTSCAVSSTGKAYCWGRGNSGELGIGTAPTGPSTPQAVSTSGVLSGVTLSQISVSSQFTCALDSSGGSYCWGLDVNGQTGNPATGVDDLLPVPVVASQPTTVTGGYNHSCSINPNGAAYCWGDDTDGELGNNTTTSTPQQTPVAVYTSGALSGVTLAQISAGQQFTCALSTAGQAYCWGLGSSGQLGNSSVSTSDVPVAVSTSGVLSGVTLIQIAAGNAFACGLATTGKAYCWGYDNDGELGNGSSGGSANSDVPVAVSQGSVFFSDLGTGDEHACALTPGGAAYCWGYNAYGEVGDNSATTPQTTPAAVYTGGALSGVSLTEIAAGDDFSCALSAAGAGYCWGYNNDGQLGDNATSTSAQSTAVAMYTSGALSGVTLTQITAGQYHACALSATGAGYCWGQDNAGQLGNNSVSNSSVAVAISASGALSGVTLTQVSAEWQHTCGMDNTATADCWGLNGNGQLGDNSVSNSSVPVRVASLAPGAPTGVYASVGNGYMLADYNPPASFGAGTLTNYTVTATYTSSGNAAPSTLSCTTSNTYCVIGGLTNGAVYLVTVTTSTSAGGSVASVPASATPWPVTNAIAAGYTHSCTISGGKAYCWGDDTYGELGNNTTTTTPQTTPVAVYTGGALSGVTLTQITAGDDFTCALSSAGAVYCWGLGTSGQLGDGSNSSSNVPVAVSTSGVLSGATVGNVSAGAGFACAQDQNGAAVCWGAGGNGELGNNSTASSNVPVAVYTGGALSGVYLNQVVAGNLHACAVGINGAAYCWGYNGFGELGNGSYTQSQVPVAVTTSGALSGVSLTSLAFTGGISNYMCALSSAGLAYCWGDGTSGQLGNGSTSSSNVPVAVTTSGTLYGTALASLTVGFDHACALSIAGAAYCWGDGGYGALGNNATSPSSVPVAVYTGGLLSGVALQQISAGQQFTCAQDSTPYDYCWGAGSSGQLGDNTSSQSTVAVYVAPQAPTGLSAAMTATTAAVSWTAPAFTNSGAITGYSAAASPGTQTCTTTSVTSCTITGLTAGSTYAITVTVTASPVGSATSSSISATTPVLQMVSPSSLTWGATDTGLNQSVADQVSGDQQLTVTDTTGSGAGWHITISATTLTAGALTLPNSGALVFTGSALSSASTSAPSTACVSTCTLPTNTTTYPVSVTTAASSPAAYTVYDTAASSGLGQVTIGGSTAANPVGWWVNLPGDAYAGTYTTTLTLQLTSGP